MESIVVVEDEPQILDLLVEILESYGYSVLAFETADAAWEHCRQQVHPIRLLITDLRMPGEIDGAELVRLVHEKFPRSPIVVVSGYHSESDSLYVERVFWLPKPFTMEQLFDTCQLLAPVESGFKSQ